MSHGNLRCSLQWKCPHKNVTGFCCTACKLRETCPDACENRPERCMMSRALTTRERATELKIKSIRLADVIHRITETGEPRGMFYYNNSCGSYAIDNRTGTPVKSERFGTYEESLLWLIARVDADEKEVEHEG